VIKTRVDRGRNNKMKKQTNEKTEKSKVVETRCEDRTCPTHGNISIRGRSFKGKVIKKFHKRITIEFERTLYIKKYERYAKKKTKLHARLPECMKEQIQIGDYVEIHECRPISKIIHFVVINKIRGGGE